MSRLASEQRVTLARPCPVCGKPDWCAFSSNGLFVHCQRLDDWNGRPAIRRSDAGWLHALSDGQRQPARPVRAVVTRASLPRPVLDQVYRRLAEFCGLDEHARYDLMETRRFPQALNGAAIYFSLPRSGSATAEASDALVREFGRNVIERVPGFAIACHACDGAGTKNAMPCWKCAGLGKARPRFRSVRGSRHDYALIGCDEDGLAFWGMARKLPFNEDSDSGKYILLSSSRAMEASVSGLPKYHVAGRSYPRRELWITEGIIKSEITAWHLRCPVIGLAGTQPDEATIAVITSLANRWSR